MRLIDQLRVGKRPEQRALTTMVAETFGAKSEGIPTNFNSYVDEGYKGNGPIFSLIQARMLTLSEVRFAWRDQDGALFRDPSLGPLETPWPGGTTGDLVARLEVYSSLAGNAYVVRRRDGLKVLRPDWVDIVLTSESKDPDSYDVAGYVYRPNNTRNRREQVVYLPEEVAPYAPIPDPAKKIAGMSWLTPVAREADADNLMIEHKGRFFKNAATPNLAVKVQRELTPTQKEDLKSQFNQRYQGVQNAWRTVLLEGGADLEVIGTDMEKMAFSTLQAQGETRLAAAAGVPPVVVGFAKGLESATYSNYGQALRRYGDITCRPLWRNMAATLQQILDRPAGADLWYDISDVAFLRQDEKDEAAIRKEHASTIRLLTDGGFTADSAVAAVTSGDMTVLEHTGVFSVQLQEPVDPEGDPNGDASE